MTAGGTMPDALCYRNEISTDPGQVRQYQAFRVELRRRGYRGAVVFGSYGVGTPDWSEWPPIVAAFGSDAPDGIDLHEYWSLTVAGSSPWWALRHVEALRRGLLPASWPIYIGECGSDDVGTEDPEHRRGWQDRGKLTAPVQQANLGAFVARCAPSVRYAFVFADGTDDPHWLSYYTFDSSIEATIRQNWTDGATQVIDRNGAESSRKGVTMLQGIDVSSLQPGTDWQQVAQTHQFAFIKATEGTGYSNPYFARDWAGASDAGIARGAYHFARPDVNSPVAEADYFLATVGPLAPGDRLVLDFEVGTGDLSGWAQTWLERVAARVGFLPILYTYPSFVTEHGLGTAALAAYPLWYASYQQQWPPVPAPWPALAIWQHSDNATVTGVAGIVDESYTTLTVQQLRALGKPAPAAAPEVLTVDEALAYYQQLGVKVAVDHAVYTVALKPMYDFWRAHKDDVVDGVPIGDLIKPGALIYPEYGAIWGNGRPAGCVKLQNRIVGAYQDEQGVYHPYQATLG